MTPESVVNIVLRNVREEAMNTKRVPDDHCQLGHLLSFLAQFHECLLPGIPVQEFSYPSDKPTMFLTQVAIQ